MHGFIRFFLLALAIASCTGQSADDGPDCATVMEKMRACYPEIAPELRCGPATLEAYRSNGLVNKDCGDLKKAEKADLFAIGGCGDGEHVCGGIFCCDDYVITWSPDEEDWEILPVVDALVAATPDDVREAWLGASDQELLAGRAWTYQQEVVEVLGGPAREMAVELSEQIIPVALEDFFAVIPAEAWGVELAHYLGGEVIVYEADGAGRSTRQLERMVLSPFPCDVESNLTNMDMTKVEVIEYSQDAAVVTWRVMASDNGSTETDVGKVSFLRWGERQTLVSFHSAHRLNAPGGVHIPNAIVEEVLRSFFLGHIRHYAELVTG
jgi:hypothetical protein